MRTGNLESAVQEALTREEENGARALLYFRSVFFVFFFAGGLTAAQDMRDTVTNLFFSAGYAGVLAVQWYLQRRAMQRALHRFGFFMILADHALFAGMLIFYYALQGSGNFNHALKSPYMVLLLIPTLLTLVQFKHTLLFFSLGTLLAILLAFLGYGLLSGMPRTTDWARYILGDAIILPAWAGLWFSLPVIIAALVAYAIFRSIRMVAEIGRVEGQRKQLSRYFSPAVVEEISAGQSSGYAFKKGERRKVAVLFADIRSFTTLSENMPPDEVAAMLSKLRSMQMKAVFDNAGMVDKFIGDAIMAVFGAPKSAGDFHTDVVNAVKCGLAMHAALAAFNTARSARGETPINIGVGIHAGDAFAGNLGSAEQLEYTVIGDVVNTASRIEHLCKKAQADFLVSEVVAAELDSSFNVGKIGRVHIRGREQPMGIHRVLH